MKCELIEASKYCYNVTDGTHDSPKQQKYGKHLITSKHIKNRTIGFENAYLISKEDYDKINNRSKVDQWDVLISMIGIYCGFCYVERNNDINYAVKNVGILKTGSKRKAEWLYYYLCSPIGKNYLQSIRAGSTQPYISLGELRKMPIPVLEHEITDRILYILDSIDEKIELNKKINDNLIELATSFHKQWFIDYKLDDFSGNMINSEVGEIPDGWSVKELGDLMNNFDSKRRPLSSRQRENRKGNIPYYGATSIMDYVDDLIFDDIYVLMGEDGSVIKEDGTPFLQYIWGKAWVNNHAHVLKGKAFSTEILYLYLLKMNVSNVITGAVQLKINQANMNSIKVVCATKDIYDKFDKIIQPVFQMIRQIKEENDRLVRLRDILLPKLMSGGIDLSDLDFNI